MIWACWWPGFPRRPVQAEQDVVVLVVPGRRPRQRWPRHRCPHWRPGQKAASPCPLGTMRAVIVPVAETDLVLGLHPPGRGNAWLRGLEDQGCPRRPGDITLSGSGSSPGRGPHPVPGLDRPARGRSRPELSRSPRVTDWRSPAACRCRDCAGWLSWDDEMLSTCAPAGNHTGQGVVGPGRRSDDDG